MISHPPIKFIKIPFFFISETSYCRQITQAEFLRQQQETTEQGIIQLMNNILDDINMSLKDKQKRVKQFQKTYPLIYMKHFSDIQ